MTTDSTETFDAVLAALNVGSQGSLFAHEGPADDLPLREDGMVEQAAVLWPTPRLNAYTRARGNRSGGVDRVRVTCVGSTPKDALAAADRVEALIGGLRITERGGRLRQEFATEMGAEPNTNPRRYLVAVEYSATMKGGLR